MANLNLAPAGPYAPAAIYHSDSDCVEYVRVDAFCIYERVDEFLTLIKDATGHQLVGFKLKGFRYMFDQLKPSLQLSDKHFLPLISALEKWYTIAGDELTRDERRMSAYRAAYDMAANDNVRLPENDLLAA